MCQRGCSSELDEKYQNKFGLIECGKPKWTKMNKTQKAKKISEIFGRMDYNARTESNVRLEGTGFKHFSEILSEYIDNDLQFVYLANHVKYDLSKITNNNKIDISDELEKFNICRTKLMKINKIYKHNNTNFFDNVLSIFVNKYQKIIVKKVKQNFASADKNKLFFDAYQMIKNMFTKLHSLFPNIRPQLKEDNDIIVNDINEYYIKWLDDKNIKKNDILNCFANLKNNEYENLSTKIIQILNTLCTYEYFRIFTKMSNTKYHYDKCIDFIELMRENYNLDPIICLKSVMFNLAYVYKNRYNNKRNDNLGDIHRDDKTGDDKTAEKVYLSEYWNQYHIMSTNPFWQSIENIKQFLTDKDIMMHFLDEPKVTDTGTGTFEKYIIAKLTELYPDEICTYDELINIVASNGRKTNSNNIPCKLTCLV